MRSGHTHNAHSGFLQDDFAAAAEAADHGSNTARHSFRSQIQTNTEHYLSRLVRVGALLVSRNECTVQHQCGSTTAFGAPIQPVLTAWAYGIFSRQRSALLQVAMSRELFQSSRCWDIKVQGTQLRHHRLIKAGPTVARPQCPQRLQFLIHVTFPPTADLQEATACQGRRSQGRQWGH